MKIMDIYPYLYIGLNLLSLALFGIDKFKAMTNRWRIPEKTLLLLGAFGPIGAFLGMFLFHHKIRKVKFRILVPLFILVHLMLFYLLIWR